MKLVPYLRVSTVRQADDGTGLEVHLDANPQMGETNGDTLARAHRDEGVSGAKELDSRPALMDALILLKDRKVSGLVVYRVDRLARDLAVQEQLLA